MFGALNRLRRRTRSGQLSRESLANKFNQRLARVVAKLPEPVVRDAANLSSQTFRRTQPAILSAGFGPQIVGHAGIPGRHVHSVGYMRDGHFRRWPARKKRLKKAPADFSVQ